MPGIAPGSRENSGYLLMGKARGAVLFHVGRRGCVFGGGCGIFTRTARICLIFISTFPTVGQSLDCRYSLDFEPIKGRGGKRREDDFTHHLRLHLCNPTYGGSNDFTTLFDGM